MDDDQLLSVANDLLQKTQRDEVVWTTTSVDDQFALKTPSGTVLVDLYKGKPSYGLAVVTASGIKIREIISKPGEPTQDILQSLYEAAFNKYHRIDQTLDDVLREIRRPGRIGLRADDDLPF